MCLRKIGLWTVMFILSLCLTVQGSDEFKRHLTKKNALSYGFGSQYFIASDYTDAWNIDKDKLDGNFQELSYERKYGKSIAFDITLGFSDASVKTINSAQEGDYSKLTINNLYLSPTAKCYLPIGDSFIVYGGIGPDLSYTDGHQNYRDPDPIYPPYRLEYSKLVYGAHGLAGVEYFIIKNPSDSEFGSFYYDWPVSLFIQYKYLWMKMDGFDEKMVDAINSRSASLSEEELDVGGHMILIGLKWHFN